MLDFLSLHPDAFGLDLSDLSLKIAKLKKTSRGADLVSFGNFPIPKGFIERGEIKKEDELAKIIKVALLKVHGEKLATPYVVASLPEEKAFLQVIQLPPMKKEEVQSAVNFELENYIPYSPETVYVDTQVVQPSQNHLNHVDVLLAALPRTTVDSYMAVLGKSGLIPLVFEIESLASARAVIRNGISPFPTLLVDIGATRTSFIVYVGYSVRFTASIAVSSAQCTQAIVKNLRIGWQQAEELKVKYGISDRESAEGKQVRAALIPSLSDLTGEIKKYTDYYEAHAVHQHLKVEEAKIKKIFLTGGGALLRDLPYFLERELKTEVTFGDPWANVFSQPLKSLPPVSFQEALPYTTAIGLALRGSTHD